MSNSTGSKRGVINRIKKTCSFSKDFIKIVERYSKDTGIPFSQIIERNCTNLKDELYREDESRKSIIRKAPHVKEVAKKTKTNKQNGKSKK